MKKSVLFDCPVYFQDINAFPARKRLVQTQRHPGMTKERSGWYGGNGCDCLIRLALPELSIQNQYPFAADVSGIFRYQRKSGFPCKAPYPGNRVLRSTMRRIQSIPHVFYHVKCEHDLPLDSISIDASVHFKRVPLRKPWRIRHVTNIQR